MTQNGEPRPPVSAGQGLSAALVFCLGLCLVGAAFAGFVVIPFAVGWLTIVNLETWWRESNFFQFVGLVALIAGMVQMAASFVVGAVALLVFKVLALQPETQRRLEKAGEAASLSIACIYGVPGIVCGWIATSWWLLTGDYYIADVHHPGILESSFGAIEFLGGRLLGIVGFVSLTVFVLKVLRAVFRRTIHGDSPEGIGVQ